MPIYHQSYLNSLKKHDNSVLTKVREYENIILQMPLDPRFIHLSDHKLRGLRRFKSGRLRILYAVYKEYPKFWNEPPVDENDVCFVLFDVRTEDTYDKAIKLLNQK